MNISTKHHVVEAELVRIYLNPSLDEDGKSDWASEGFQLYLGAFQNPCIIQIKTLRAQEELIAWQITQTDDSYSEEVTLFDSLTFEPSPSHTPTEWALETEPYYHHLEEAISRVADKFQLEGENFFYIFSEPEDAVDPGEDYQCDNDCLIDFYEDANGAERFMSMLDDKRVLMLYKSRSEGQTSPDQSISSLEDFSETFYRIHPDDVSEADSRTFFVFMFEDDDFRIEN